MAKKYPSELNTRTIRIGIGAYVLLAEMSRRTDVTIAEALDLLLGQQQEQIKKAPPQQIRLPEVSMPALSFKPKTISSDGTVHVRLKSIR